MALYLPVLFCDVFMFKGKVQKGETVLIHAGASGVGTAAIQLCRFAGVVPIVTAGSAEKLEFAKKLGAASGFNYREEDFGTKCLEATNSKFSVTA